MFSLTANICTLPARVLLATDLTDLKQMLPVAIEYSLRYKAELKLVHVLPDLRATDIDPSLLGHADRETGQQHAEAFLADAVKAATKAGVKCSWLTPTGPVAETLGQVVREWNPDRVIVGSHGSQKLQQKLLGSVAESIFREIQVPVFAINPGALRGKWPPAKRPRVLFATALDRESRALTAWVLECARIHQADLTMLHVIPDVVKAHPSAVRVRAYAERIFEEILSDDVSAESPRPSCMIERGRTVETILLVARRGRFDLIILGAVSGSSFRQEIIPGTAYGVICEAPCPVLVLKDVSLPGVTSMSVAS
jgi:nucleotide-binding universal stress UspA family protein